jgi:hypothetical protein
MESPTNEREHPYHERLTLQNFTVFADQTFEFVSGINVLIGKNGTGKTHVMKALYAWQMARHTSPNPTASNFFQVFDETYGISESADFIGSRKTNAYVEGQYGGHSWNITFHPQGLTGANSPKIVLPLPIFMPAIELMAHARNMLGVMRNYADFDRTCFDFLSLVTAEPLRAELNGFAPALSRLQKIMPGKIEWNSEEQRFYLIEKKKRIAFSLVAEGVRKISGLYCLIDNGWIKPGTTLFWDEPEANINPEWMDEIVETLVLLAESGVQIFLATHDYVVLKELDLLLRERAAQKKPVVTARYFALNRERGITTATWSDDFSELKSNAILDQYRQMMGRDIRLQDVAE